jgi:hypothetical protein
MSRESQIIQRNIARESITEEIILNEEDRALYISTQRHLIGYLSEQILQLVQGKSRFESELIAAEIVGATYHHWFQKQVGFLNSDRFVSLYNGTHGPKNLFNALFPGQEVVVFLKAYLSCLESADLVENDLAATKAEVNKALEVA